jgi:transcriptional regulator with GAF, ATPase, and Fis domain
MARKIAAVPSEPGGGLVTTLITGETGTGKEVIARLIHHHSPRGDQPLVQVNCTAIPENLFEAELFGHERGTFTDAKAGRKGLFEVAHEGTLLLDEIGDMPMSMQAKLLVALENGRFRRLGGSTERTADVMVMAATNSDLERKVDAGEFRADLYYRLKMFCVELPPLRERGVDLILLAEHFIERFSRKFHRTPPGLTAEAREQLRRYPWPGNVRELAHVLQRALLVSSDNVLDLRNVGIDRTESTSEQSKREVLFDFSNGSCTMAAVEKHLLQAAMEHTQGNTSEAARLLGLTRGGLRHRLDKLGISPKKVSG